MVSAQGAWKTGNKIPFNLATMLLLRLSVDVSLHSKVIGLKHALGVNFGVWGEDSKDVEH